MVREKHGEPRLKTKTMAGLYPTTVSCVPSVVLLFYLVPVGSLVARAPGKLVLLLALCVYFPCCLFPPGIKNCIVHITLSSPVASSSPELPPMGRHVN